MAIKSKAQRRKFAELLVEGKISPETFEEWNREAGDTELPERVGKTSSSAKRKRTSKKSKSTSARKATTTRKTTARESSARNGSVSAAFFASGAGSALVTPRSGDSRVTRASPSFACTVAE